MAQDLVQEALDAAYGASEVDAAMDAAYGEVPVARTGRPRESWPELPLDREYDISGPGDEDVGLSLDMQHTTSREPRPAVPDMLPGRLEGSERIDYGIEGYSAGQAGKDVAGGMMESTGTALRMVGELEEFVPSWWPDLPAGVRDRMGRWLQENAPKGEEAGLLPEIMRATGSSLPVLAGAALVAPTGALGVAGVIGYYSFLAEGGQEFYTHLAESPDDREGAYKAFLLGGSFAAVTENLALGPIAKRMGRALHRIDQASSGALSQSIAKGMAGRAALHASREMPAEFFQEGGQSLMSDIISRHLREDEIPLFEAFMETMQDPKSLARARRQGLIGALAVGPLSVIGTGLEGARARLSQEAGEAQPEGGLAPDEAELMSATGHDPAEWRRLGEGEVAPEAVEGGPPVETVTLPGGAVLLRERAATKPKPIAGEQIQEEGSRIEDEDLRQFVAGQREAGHSGDLQVVDPAEVEGSEVVQGIAEGVGTRIDYVQGETRLPRPAAYRKGRIIMDARLPVTEQVRAVLAHELAHHLRATGRAEWDALVEVIDAIDPTLLPKSAREYARRLKDDSLRQEELDDESVAFLFEEAPEVLLRALEDPAEMQRLANEKPGVLRKIIDAIRAIASRLGLMKSPEMVRLEKLLGTSPTGLEQKLGPEAAARLSAAVAEAFKALVGTRTEATALKQGPVAQRPPLARGDDAAVEPVFPGLQPADPFLVASPSKRPSAEELEARYEGKPARPETGPEALSRVGKELREVGMAEPARAMESGVPKRGAPGAERRRRTEPSRAESAAAAYEEGEDVRFAAAYHGTGAEFDRFSDDKIGTGEGAQAYGDGHYFASTREVAEWYRKQLGGRDWKPQLDGRDVEDSDGRVPAYAAAALLRQGDGFGRVSFVQDAINSLRQEAAEIRDDGSAGSAEEAKGYDRDAEWLEEHKDRVSYRKPGRLLKVDLAPAEDEYLLWDTLLDEQPATVQRALEATDWYSYAKDRLDVLPDNPTGRDLYKDMLADRSPREASAALLAAGVRGIKYLEGASRSKGEGNYNYVIFDPADIKITARFAVAPPLDSPAFKRWFDDSKVVDESGKPLVVYHGTTANFSEFEPSWHDETVWEGSAFSTNPEVARAYADDDFHRRSPGDDAGSRIMPVYIASDVFPTSMEMHRIIERELGEDWWDNKETRDQWRDVALRLGIRAINTEDIGAPGEIFVIDPTAVKSATGNRGTYDAANPDVRFAVGPGESRRLNRMAAVIDAAYARGEGARAERWEGLLAEAEEAIGTREEALLEGNADEDLEGVNVAETDSRDLEDWIIHSWRSMRGDDLERSPSALGYDATDIAGNIRGNVQNAGISIPPSVTDGDLLDLAKELSRDRSAMVAARRARDVRFAAGEPQDAPLEEIDGGALAPLPAGTEQEDALEEITVPGRGSVAAAIQGVFRGKLSGAAAIPVAEGGEFALPAEDDLQALNRKFADYFARARVAQRRAGEQGEEADVDLAETTYYGRARARIDRLALVYDKPLKGVAQKVGLENLDRYLIALHTPTRRALMEERHPKVAESAAPEWGSGMSLEDARGVVAEVEASPQRALYRRGARLVHQMLSEALDTRVEAGLLSEEGATAWREQFGGAYVPLKTDKDPADHSFRAGRGFAVTGAESKRARGRESLADSPTAFSASQAVQVVQRAEKNRVGLALLELVRQNPSANVWEEVAPTRGRDGALVPPKQEYHTVTGALDKKDQLVPSLFMLKEDGQERYIRLKDPLMAQAMSKMGMAHASSVVAALAKVSRLLSAMATSWNPEFLLRNFSKDLQTASVHIAGEESAAMALEVVKSTPASIRGIWRARRSPKAAGRWEDAYREFSMAGGETGWTGSSLTIEERMNALAKEMERGYTLSALQGIGSLLNDANGAVENGVRLAAFVAARKRGVSRARAASLAKHLTVNFNRKGEWGTVMNSLWLFYNAGLQGNLEMLSRLGRSRRVQAIAGGIVAASFALSLLNRLMAGDDEDGVGQWEKTQEWVKQDYWIFMYPDGSGRRVTIPVPWGYNVFHSVGIQLEHVIFGDKPAPEAVGNVGLAVMDAFNPLGQSASLSQWLAPTVVDPVVQVSENQTWYGGTIYPNNFDNRPDSQLYWADVTPAARDAVELLNRLTGGTKARPGMIDVSPETIEHVLGFAGSGAGRFGLNSLKTVQDAISGEELDWNKLPILRAFFGTEDPRFTERLFSENTRLIDVAEKEAKVDAENQKTPWLVRLGRYASRAQTRVKKAKQSGNDDAAHEIMRQLNRRVREAAESRNQ